MKVELKKYEHKVFGIKLVPEDKLEEGILERFYVGGVFAQGFSTSHELSLTFKDLIEQFYR